MWKVPNEIPGLREFYLRVGLIIRTLPNPSLIISRLAFQIKSCIILPGRESYNKCISVIEMLVFSRD